MAISTFQRTFRGSTSGSIGKRLRFTPQAPRETLSPNAPLWRMLAGRWSIGWVTCTRAASYGCTNTVEGGGLLRYLDRPRTATILHRFKLWFRPAVPPHLTSSVTCTSTVEFTTANTSVFSNPTTNPQLISEFCSGPHDYSTAMDVAPDGTTYIATSAYFGSPPEPGRILVFAPGESHCPATPIREITATDKLLIYFAVKLAGPYL